MPEIEEAGVNPPNAQEDALNRIADQLGKDVDAYRQSVRDLDKWLTTSLLAINGGALIAVANLDWLPNIILRMTGGLLVLGLVLAFLSGGATAHVGRKVSILYTELLANWGGHGTEAEVAKAHRILQRHVWIAGVFRVASLAAFLGAIYTVSEALPARATAEAVATSTR
ncbi:MAG TPA: hypothetical protein VF620_06415 [Allosphingosinicella sp.]|jgi:hypothetical protein